LFYLHNESINIWSHFLGAIGFAIAAPIIYRRLKPLYRTASAEDYAVFLCFFIGAIGCLTMSGTFHLLCHHSAEVARWANQLDYVGIVLLIWGSFIPSIYYGFQERTDLIKLYWTMVCHAAVIPKFYLNPFADMVIVPR
jgi:adiponectin receptor